MKRPWIKRGLLVLVILVALVGVPIIINECYKANDGYITLWGAADTLSYYGMILAAAGTGIGVFASIRFSHKQYEENKRRDVLPFFSINMLSQSKVDPFLKGFAEALQINCFDKEDTTIDGLEYKEYLDDKVYFLIEASGISCTKELDNDHRKKAEADVTAVIEMLGSASKESAIYLAHELQNVGNGCAINLFLSLLSSSGEKVFSDHFSVIVGRKLYLGLYIERSEKVIGEYRIDLGYQDIFGNVYSQSRMLSVEKSEQNGLIQVTEWTEENTRQVLIMEDTTHADA